MSDHAIDPSSFSDTEHVLSQLRRQQAAADACSKSLQARIDSLSAQSIRKSSIHKQRHHRGHDVPRTMPTDGTPSMSRHVSSDRADANAISRSLSQRSATSLSRTASRGSTARQTNNVPFVSTSNNVVRPLQLSAETRQEPSVLMEWTNDHSSFTSYTQSHQSHPIQRSISHRKSNLPGVPEHSRALQGIGQDPGDFLACQMNTSLLQLPPPPALSLSTDVQDYQATNNVFSHSVPPTPSTSSLTNATSFDNNTMSRSTSLLGDNLEMMRINSSASCSQKRYTDHEVPHFVAASSNLPRHSSTEEQTQLLVGTGGVSNFSDFFQSHPDHLPSTDSFGISMEKSESNESSSSSASRNRLRLKVQNQLAASRVLQPRGGDVRSHVNRLSQNSSAQSRLESRNRALDKIAISKPSYQRPKHDRIPCDKCNAQPDGFRGEHELRRHMDREHRQIVKKWVVVQPVGEDRLKPVHSIAACKSCGVQKKQYGAYYNVAAHLRRAHFKPKSSKNRNKGSKDTSKKSDGMAAGHWPPMSELKHWMEEIEVEANTVSERQTKGEETISDEEVINTATVNTHDPRHFDSFDDGFYSHTSEDAAYSFDSTTADVYESSPLFTLSNQGMNASMFNSSSQDVHFPFSSQGIQGDPLALLDVSLLPPYFEDSGSMTGSSFLFS